MKISKKLREMIEKAQTTDAYWVSLVKLDFAKSLETRRRKLNLTNASIAEKIGSSAPYISKVFRGDTNLTIESMVKLARATGGRIEIRVVDASVMTNKWDVTLITTLPAGTNAPRISVPSSQTLEANGCQIYDWQTKMKLAA